MRWIIGLVFILMGAGILYASDIPKIGAVDAIIGEAEGEPYEGMLAIAAAIRNRGTLQGVQGLQSERVKKHRYGSKVFVNAIRAYEDSRTKDPTNGADSWFTLDYNAQWIEACEYKVTIGHHKFYKCNK
jgi:hypothetical protein